MAVPGIDVSNHQPLIDWQKVASSGVQFAWCKVSEGITYTDHLGIGHINIAEASGIPAGGYHFARPGTNSPQAEAAYFLARLPRSRLRPVLDLEVTTLDKSATIEWAHHWLEAVEAAGHRPILYTYSAFANQHLDASLGNWDLWLANYRATPPSPPLGWQRFVAWQHSSDGNVPGVPGRCDVSLADHLNDLLANPGPVPPLEEDMAPAVAFDAHGTQWFAVRGIDNHLWTKEGDGAWTERGGTLTSGPSIAVKDDGSLVFAARGSDGATWWCWVSAGGVWSPWVSAGGKS